MRGTVMRYLVASATAAAIFLLATGVAGAAPNRDPFADETPQQREARKADLRDLQEREERSQELKEQHEIDHPEVLYDERDDDLEE